MCHPFSKTGNVESCCSISQSQTGVACLRTTLAPAGSIPVAYQRSVQAHQDADIPLTDFHFAMGKRHGKTRV